MSFLRIAEMGHPILRQVAEPVDPAVIKTNEFQKLCDDMESTMRETDGIGLAAPQVYHSIQLLVAQLDEDAPCMFFINPKVTDISNTTSESYEGCLSVPGIRALVARPDHITVTALDRNGDTFSVELAGFPATIFQHEVDHLSGILYIDKCDTTTMAFMDEHNRFSPPLLEVDVTSEIPMDGDTMEIATDWDEAE